MFLFLMGSFPGLRCWICLTGVHSVDLVDRCYQFVAWARSQRDVARTCASALMEKEIYYLTIRLRLIVS